MNTNLGKRIKYFRKRAGLSQLQLEAELGSSSGYISRVESGKVNPGKEFLLKLSRVLHLTSRESNYLVGVTAEPATKQEINEAISEIKEYYSNRGVFAYLLDDRYRVLAISKGIETSLPKFHKDTNELKKKVLNKSIMHVIFDDSLQLNKYLDKEKLNELYFYQIARFYSELGFLIDDSYYSEVVHLLESKSEVKRIWETVQQGNLNLANLESKNVVLNLFGVNISLRYVREPLVCNNRFESIEYIPTSKFLKFLAKLL